MNELLRICGQPTQEDRSIHRMCYITQKARSIQVEQMNFFCYYPTVRHEVEYQIGSSATLEVAWRPQIQGRKHN